MVRLTPIREGAPLRRIEGRSRRRTSTLNSVDNRLRQTFALQDQPLRSQTNSRPETSGGWCTVPWACESASGLNGTGQGADRESAASSGNHRAERFSGATNIRDSLSCLTRSRRGRISWSGGNAYKRARGQGVCANASTPNGGRSRGLRENHHLQCVFSLDAKRSTCAVPNLCQISLTMSGCNRHSSRRGPPRDMRSAPKFWAPAICRALRLRRY